MGNRRFATEDGQPPNPVAAVAAADAALVAAALRDARAFAPLYRRYADPVYRYCLRRLGSREAAEDAAGRVFVKALEALPSFKGGSFRAWLFAIAHNAVVDDYRAARPTAPLPGDRPDPAQPDPERVLIAAEAAGAIRAVLARLPPEQRRVVELRLAGLPDAEIAQVLGRSHGSVRTAQWRALRRLREILLPDGKEADRAPAPR